MTVCTFVKPGEYQCLRETDAAEYCHWHDPATPLCAGTVYEEFPCAQVVRPGSVYCWSHEPDKLLCMAADTYMPDGCTVLSPDPCKKRQLTDPDTALCGYHKRVADRWMQENGWGDA